MLQSEHRLRRARDVQRVRRQGRSWRHPLVILLMMANDRPVSRFAFIASRRVGNAVTRNRVKRLLREAVRLEMPHIAPGWDCVFIARHPLTAATFAQTQTAVRQLLHRADIRLPDETRG